MSRMQEKLLHAAAVRALADERARCLWCIDATVAELKQKINKAILTPAQVHMAQTKLKIAGGLALAFRRAIISGVGPASKGSLLTGSDQGSALTGQSDTADLSAAPTPEDQVKDQKDET